FYFSSSRSSLCLMRDKAIISNLHLKFAEKTWSETFQLVRRCMEKSRDASKPCEPLVRSLERLQKPNLLWRRRCHHLSRFLTRMGFHATEATCYLTGNLFYVEVVLLPHGEVQEVKVAPHGKPPSVSRLCSESHNFADFSLRLGAFYFNLFCIFFFSLKTSNLKAVVQAAQVTVGVSGVTHRLQMASVLPQLCLAFTPLSEGPHETLPACFLLRLQPPVPVMSSFVEKLKQITDVAVPEFNLQWAPLPKLLLKASRSSDPCGDTRSDQDRLPTQPLPGGVTHSYVLPGTAWDAPTQRATVVDGVPFTQPAHVPALLELLRHQCAINTLLRSCVCAPSLICEWHFEVIPESATSFSVTFHQPHTDSLAVLLVNVSNPHQITCKLFGSGICDSSLDEHVSTVMRSCMSIPVTMKALYSRMEEMISGPVSPSRLATTGAENPHFTPKMDTNKESPTVSQSAAVPEGGAGVSSSACDAKSELPSGINTSSPVNS
uniref:Mediator of RNA polymerase II transcription subunit 1 n=1 Tax=Kryptolebias marmoratus TaxID=37003 RepID=A0A3Q3B5T9_KRYMA